MGSPSRLEAMTEAPPPAHLSGRPLRRFTAGYAVAVTVAAALVTSIGMIVLPNHVQALEFARWFVGADAGVDLLELGRLRTAVDAGRLVPTADQTRLLGLLASFEAARASGLGLLTAVSAAAAMLVGPVVGLLSDRTRSRWGRRAPWIVLGALAGAGLLVGLRFATTLAALVALWSLARVAFAASAGPLGTTVADRVPPRRIGLLSSVSALGGYVGGAVAAIVVGLLYGPLGLDLYPALGVAAVAASVLFVGLAPDHTSLALPDAAGGPNPWRGLLHPFADPDFRWLWVSRLAMSVGYLSTVAFPLYLMQAYIRPALTAAEATALTPVMGAAALPGTMAALLLAGRLSDRLGRRKPFVVGSSLLLAASMAIPVVWPTLPGLFAQAIVSGIAFGTYMTVSGALTMEVLPSPADAGRDLGVAQLSQAVGSTLAPLLAGWLVAASGGYLVLWPVAATLILVSMLFVAGIKKAR